MAFPSVRCATRCACWDRVDVTRVAERIRGVVRRDRTAMGTVLAIPAPVAQARMCKIPWMGGCTCEQDQQTGSGSDPLLLSRKRKVLRMHRSLFLGDFP